MRYLRHLAAGMLALPFAVCGGGAAQAEAPLLDVMVVDVGLLPNDVDAYVNAFENFYSFDRSLRVMMVRLDDPLGSSEIAEEFPAGQAPARRRELFLAQINRWKNDAARKDLQNAEIPKLSDWVDAVGKINGVYARLAAANAALPGGGSKKVRVALYARDLVLLRDGVKHLLRNEDLSADCARGTDAGLPQPAKVAAEMILDLSVFSRPADIAFSQNAHAVIALAAGIEGNGHAGNWIVRRDAASECRQEQPGISLEATIQDMKQGARGCQWIDRAANLPKVTSGQACDAPPPPPQPPLNSASARPQSVLAGWNQPSELADGPGQKPSVNLEWQQPPASASVQLWLTGPNGVNQSVLQALPAAARGRFNVFLVAPLRNDKGCDAAAVTVTGTVDIRGLDQNRRRSERFQRKFIRCKDDTEVVDQIMEFELK